MASMFKQIALTQCQLNWWTLFTAEYRGLCLLFSGSIVGTYVLPSHVSGQAWFRVTPTTWRKTSQSHSSTSGQRSSRSTAKRTWSCFAGLLQAAWLLCLVVAIWQYAQTLYNNNIHQPVAFLSYTLLILAGTPFCLQNCFSSSQHGIKKSICFKVRHVVHFFRPFS